ncbi:MAG: DUF4474 domain-containing protein [Gracilibacteraceae bacterium]|nr:DUF4474 domain-containing protein [Gracilibacteraceae bacterium]
MAQKTKEQIRVEVDEKSNLPNTYQSASGWIGETENVPPGENLERDWWLNGFQPGSQTAAENIQVIGSITFQDAKMRDEFTKEFEKAIGRGHAEAVCSLAGNVFTFDWYGRGQYEK